MDAKATLSTPCTPNTELGLGQQLSTNKYEKETTTKSISGLVSMISMENTPVFLPR